MVAVPAATPVTIPELAPTEATAGLLLLQVPPPRPPLLVKVVVDPSQRVKAPLTEPAFGSGSTVIVFEALAVPQPVTV